MERRRLWSKYPPAAPRCFLYLNVDGKAAKYFSHTDLSGSAPSIVAVHGLNPRNKKLQDHAWDTWRKPAGLQGRLWLRDYLPNDLPDARIFLYEYDSAVLGSNKESFVDAGSTLLEWLRIARHQVRSCTSPSRRFPSVV